MLVGAYYYGLNKYDIDGLVKEIKTEAFTLDESICNKFKQLIK